MQIENVMRALLYGDTQPALVVSTDPLLIAAYSDEMDAVVMLRFFPELAREYDLAPGTRLTTSNVYFNGEGHAQDIFIGEHSCGRYADFMPIVQLFLGKKEEKIRAKVDLFDEQVWNTVAEKADEYLHYHPDLCRDGFYYFKK